VALNIHFLAKYLTILFNHLKIVGRVSLPDPSFRQDRPFLLSAQAIIILSHLPERQVGQVINATYLPELIGQAGMYQTFWFPPEWRTLSY
jgi:hypothetical protein